MIAPPLSLTALTRTPRASHSPGRGLSAVPRQVQSRPSALVAYSVAIRSAWSGSASGCVDAHRCQTPPCRTITGSFTAFSASPGSTTLLRRASKASGLLASITSTRQCLVPVVAQLRYSRQAPSGVRTRAGRSSDSASISALPIVSSVSKRTPSADRATATAYPRPCPSGRRNR